VAAEPESPAAAGDQPVLAERRGPVLLLTLNRPERMNGWTEDLEDRYFELLDEAEADPEVGAVVLTGAGRGFCAGADFDDLATLTEGGSAGISGSRPRWRPYLFPKPLVAALNGATAGLGLVQALYCDVRFAAAEAKITTAFSRRGLIAEYGIAWMLPRLLGAGRARDLLLSGRVISGAEAAEIGLVEWAPPPEEMLDAALAYAEELATQCSPASIAVIKRQLREAAESEFVAAAEQAEGLLHESLRRPDLAEGIASFTERRDPDFPPLPAGLA
jgi:enoyl-CoA hydratase/carnithine racemase